MIQETSFSDPLLKDQSLAQNDTNVTFITYYGLNDAKTKLRNKKRYRVFEINFDKITKWSSAKQNFSWFADLVDLD